MTERVLIPVEDCLQAAIEAVGTNKQVGGMIWQAMDSVAAGKKLAHCIGPHAQRLDYDEERLVWILELENGSSDGFKAYAESIGYRVEPLDTPARAAAMARLAERTAERAGQMAERATNLSAKALALANARHLKVEA